MNQQIKFFIVIFALVLFFASNNLFAENKYIGVQKCSMCHKGEKKNKVYEKWQSTAHANAYKTLLTDKAKEIAKKKGLKVAASDADECLKCHVTGYMKNDVRDASSKKEDGVGCESCHGAASAYVLKHGKDKVEGNKLGLVRKAEESLCQKCHNSESPTYDAKKYKNQLKDIEKIKHW